MKTKTFSRLLAFALFFMAYWFFGNLYEEIVLAPNNLTHSYEALVCWQNFFTITNQVFYYVPFTQIAVLIILWLYFRTTDKTLKPVLKKAAVYGLLSLAITALIVTQLNVKLFFGDLNKYIDQLYTLSVIWLIGNGIRLYFVGACLYYTFQVYISARISETSSATPHQGVPI